MADIINTALTHTHIFEERRVETKLPKNKLWREVISELKFRMGKHTTVVPKKKAAHEWVFTNRSGIDTSVSISETENGVVLKFSRRIGFAGPKAESIIAGGILSLIILGYLYLIKEPLFLKTLVFLLILFGALSYIIYKFNVVRRKKRREDFQHLANQVAKAIPFEYEEDLEATSESDSLEPEPGHQDQDD